MLVIAKCSNIKFWQKFKEKNRFFFCRILTKERRRWKIQQDSPGRPEATGGHPTKLYQLRYRIQKLFSIWRLDPLRLDRPVKLGGMLFRKTKKIKFGR
jgi:hypothetical protein